MFSYAEQLLERLRGREKVYEDTLLNTAFQTLEEQKMVKGRRDGIQDAIKIVLQLNKDFFDSKTLKSELKEKEYEVY
jgi:hypothetical protein